MADDVTMTVVEATKAGIDVGEHEKAVAGNAADDAYFIMPNDGKTILACVCVTGPAEIVFTAVKDKYGRTETLAITPGTDKTTIIGPFMPELWNDETGCLKFQAGAGTGVVTDKYLAVRVAKPR